MTTSVTAFLSDVLSGDTIPPGKLAYFQDRAKYKIYDLVIRELEDRQSKDPSFTKAVLARRVGKKPEQITRWLSTPGNMTIDTVATLLLGINGSELDASTKRLGADQVAISATMRNDKPISKQETIEISSCEVVTATVQHPSVVIVAYRAPGLYQISRV